MENHISWIISRIAKSCFYGAATALILIALNCIVNCIPGSGAFVYETIVYDSITRGIWFAGGYLFAGGYFSRRFGNNSSNNNN